ncbi:MAG: hypothetical protein JO256_08055 [Alphaproteobacteria bacterium]|nr:hypothetical protein [Alphaproteobacteria bacterium]
MIRYRGLAMLLAVFQAVPALADTAFQDAALSIPMTDGEGAHLQLAGRLCLPQGVVKPRVALLNHPAAIDPAADKLTGCDSEQAQWFLARNFAVAFVQRRGYGATGGAMKENPACGRGRDPVLRAGLEGARDVEAAVAFLASVSQLRHDGMVVQGLSAGGWATIAFGALKDPRVAALMNFAGGRSCGSADEVAAAAYGLGGASNVPMLWVYRANDMFFQPDFVAAVYKGYTRGGGKADLHAMPAYGPTGNDGHNFWNRKGASVEWTPIVEAYLKERGVMGPDGKAAP